MTIVINGKNFKLTKALQIYVNMRIKKIEKLSPYTIKKIKVELDVDKNPRFGTIHSVKISVHLPKKIIKASQQAEDMREAIDLCVPKLLRQLKKYKTKTTINKQPGNKSIRIQ